MKFHLLFSFITISFLCKDPDFLIGSYAIESDNNFSIIELKMDSTFTYKDLGISTLAWHTFEGVWEYSNDTLTLKEKPVIFKAEEYLDGDYKDSFL